MQNKRATLVLSSIFLISAVLCSRAYLAAQVSNTGTVLGTVTDSSAAFVPGVAVTLRNSGNGLVYQTQTDQSGQFRFLTVPVGEYGLTAEKAGFSKTAFSSFPVHAAEPARVDLVLKVGSTSEQITVTGGNLPVINTVTANEGNTITGEQVNNLPLTNRVFTQLMDLEPGVSKPVDVTPGFGSNSSVDFSVNGVRDDENNLLIDGVRNVDTFGGNAFVAPNLFAVSEVRIENNDYTATAGRSAGAQVNLISRAGTNSFHGDVFEFFRNDVFNAMNRFSTVNPEARYNDFGYDVGGPIKKNRLFFFWSEEWRRIIQSSGPVITLAPTAEERQGNFNDSAIQPIDPTTGQPFQNNTIPGDRLDQNAFLLLQTYFPMPTPGYNLDGFNFISEAPDYTRWREESVRVDAKANSKLSLFGRYTQDNVLLDNPYGLFHENPFPYVGGSTQNFPIYNWSVHAIYTPRPTLFTEFSVGMYFANDKSLVNGPLSSEARAPGLTLQQVFPLDELDRIPTMFFGTGYAGIVEQWYFHNDAFSVPIQSDTTWVHGHHTVRFGLVYTPEGKSELANPSDNNTNGTYNFVGNFTNNALADFELGLASNYTETALDPFGKYRWYNLEPYAEDQIKIRNNLTLTAALRYAYFQPEYELHNMFGAFDPAFFNPANASTVNPDGTIVPSSGNLLNGIIVGGHNAYPGANSSPYGRALFPSHKRAFAPRVGVSWDPRSNGKTALRAGYGIFYDRWGSYSQFGAFSPPFNSSVNITNTSLDNPGGTPGTLYPAGLNAALVPWKYPTVQKWSLSVQHEIVKDTSASIAYVGTRGAHLLGYFDDNQGQPNAQVAQYNISPDSVRPYQGFSQITAYANIFNSNYNALQASLIHRLKNGLSFQASYTYSKTLTDNAGPNATVPSFPQDSYNIKAEYGPSDFDRTHILTFNYSWELPIFKHSVGATRAILGGWQLSGITVFQSGAPLTVTLFGDQAGVGSYNERVNQLGNPFQAGTIAGNPSCSAPSQVRTLNNWFNPCAFELQPLGTFGDERVGALRGPRFQNWDMGLAKKFAVGESRSLQFHLEGFNVFNHPSWGTPDLYLDDAPGLFSTINNATSARIVQISLALNF
ncbi:MAG: carboxypeptidase regulatory-like domain-containing protein [Candidatus Sulfotelmatobacter sp.]